MAGHSKFKNIMYRKGAQDKKRASLFSKISKEITVAAKLGSPDPEQNARLRSAIQLAKANSFPKDNIERAINKSSINDEINFENLRYEGFGPEKVAVIVETLTDNKNRTASNIRTIFQKAGGNLGTQGSASHNFNQIGIIKIDKSEISDEDIFELAINAGANECKSNNDFHEVQCPSNDIYIVKKELEIKIKNFIYTGIEWIPLNNIEIPKDKKDELINFFERLEENDDVQNIYSNEQFSI